MNIKSVSFSAYKAKVDIYKFEKLSLFAFLFTRIILDEKLDKKLKIVDCLSSLDIKEDLLYLFNNVYYSFVDNRVIEEIKEDIYDLKLEDITINKRFITHLKNGYMPILTESITKEFVYDYLKDKPVVSDVNYNDSNIILFRVNDQLDKLEEVINKNKKSLFNIDNGECILKEVIINPYYFDVSLKENNGKYYSDLVNKDIIYKALTESSLYLNNNVLKGDILTNNIYFKCVYGKESLKDYSEYVFVNDKNKEFEIKDNLIYVSFNMDEGDFIDLCKGELYRCGEYLLEDNSRVSTYLKQNCKKISEFKLYLTKNKDKFKTNIKHIIDLI